MNADAHVSTTTTVEVVKVRRGQVTLRFEDGSLVTARAGDSVTIAADVDLAMKGPR